jgi:hypothetical protein
MLLFLLLSFSIGAHSSVELALSMVPKSKIFENHGRIYILKTLAGTKIGIEFKLDGNFKEASGINLNRGDEFEPGEGLISLSTAAHSLTKTGIRPEGSWLLENDEKLGWIYDLQGTIINAKNGQMIKKIEYAKN